MKKLCMYGLIAAILLFGAACSDGSTAPPEEKPAVILEEIDEVLPNPFKGFVPWVGSVNTIYQTKLQYKTYEWRDVESQEGIFDWSAFEQNWGNIALTGRRVGFRISAVTPGSGNAYDIPDWLAAKGVALRGYSIDGHQGLAPDWDDPLFLEAHRNLLLALGARYDGDPRIAWIDIGSYGFWGEWHVYLNDTLAASQASKQIILEHYFEAFPNTPKVIAFDDDFATAYVAAHGGGIRNDCLGTAASNNWYLESLNRIDPGLNDQVWKNAIITGEFCGGGSGAAAGTSERFDLNLDFVKQTHWSFIGPAGGVVTPQDEQHRANLDLLHKTLGYRFVIRAVDHAAAAAPGGSLAISLTVENKGVAPFYFDWPLVAYLVAADGSTAMMQELAADIRTWLPGVHTLSLMLNLPADLPASEYDVKLAIHDPLTGAPGVMFANTGRDEAGRYLVSKLSLE